MVADKVFISHSSKDAATARAVAHELETRDLKCWIAPRDIPIGGEYDEAIIAAIHDCRAMVVLVSSDSIASRHVRSEVARASAEQKRIYPVRLIDIEVAGGLQFHLELSQWVDFFPSPTVESYDRLAEAIRTGAKNSQVTRRQIDPRRWAIFTVAAVALLIIGSIFGLQAYYSWQDRNFEVIAAQEQAQFEADTARIEAARREEALKSIDINPTFVLRGGEIYILSLYRVGFPPNTDMLRIGVSINGGPPQTVPYPVMSQFKLDIAPRQIRSLTFSVTEPDGSLVASLDKSSEVQQVLRPLVEGTRQRIDSIGANELHCDAGGCEIDKSLLCDAGVASVSMARSGATFSLPSSYCDEVSPLSKYCLPAQNLSFDLTPGQPVEFTFTLVDGSEVRREYPVQGSRYQNAKMNFVELEPAPGNEDAPALFMSYTPPGVVVGQIDFVLGWGSCSETFGLNSDGGQQGSHSLFGNLDGRGLVPNGGGQFSVNQFSLPWSPGFRDQFQVVDVSLMMDQPEVSFAIGTSNQITEGPWTYTFDFASALASSLPPDRMPEVRCTQDGNSAIQTTSDQRDYCYAADPDTFLDVAFVEFGESAGQPSVQIPIEFTPEEYATGTCGLDMPHCPLRFEIPEGWSEIYSRVTMKSRQQLLETRHLRPKQ